MNGFGGVFEWKVLMENVDGISVEFLVCSLCGIFG